MEIQEILNYITNNSFAIVVAVYSLVINNKAVKENTEVVQKLCMLIENIAK